MMQVRSPRAVRMTATLMAMATVTAFAQTPSVAQKAKSDATFRNQFAAVMREKTTRTPAMRKMDQELVFAVRTAKGEKLLKDLPKLEITNGVRKDGTVDVEIGATITSGLLGQLQTLGAQIGGVYPKFNSLSARIPVRSLESAAMVPGVRSVRAPGKGTTASGSVQTEGDVAIRANSLRSIYGLSGTGVKVGVLSDSNDSMEQSQSTNDLPASVQVIPGRSGRPSTGEGSAMMEIVYDVSPGSPLAFGSALGGQAAYAQTYLDLFNAGCKVLVDDYYYFAEPAFQDGLLAKTVNDISRAGGIVFSCAGNENNVRSNSSGVWEGDFVNSGDEFETPFGTATEVHSFGGSTSNQIQAAGIGVLNLQWNDQYYTPESDYDLFLVDAEGNVITYSAATNNQEGGTAYEAVVSNTATNRFAKVTRYAGSDRVLRLNQLRGTLQAATGGQIWGHLAAEEGFGVATINAPNDPKRAFNAADVPTFYSSDGPRRIYYDESGVQIAPSLTYAGALIRQQPVITAADRVATTVPGFFTFYGTSAAAPHAAALTALLKQFAPDATRQDIRSALTLGATDLLTPGWDKDAGYGAISGIGAIRQLMEQKSAGISPDEAFLHGTDSINMKLDIGRPAPPSGLTVKLTATGDVGVVTFPDTVTIPAGAKTVTFPVQGANGPSSGQIDLKATEKTTYAVLGYAFVAKSPAVLIDTLNLNYSELVGGARNAIATVTLTEDAPSTYYFDIQSSNPAAASVPASSAIGYGGMTKTFTVTTYPVAADTNVKIRVRKKGTADPWIEKNLLVKAPKPNSCVPNPTSGKAGTIVTFTLKLDGPAPAAGLKIGLTTTDAAIIAVPGSLTFASGESQKTFQATVGQSQVKKIVTVSVRYQLQTMAQGKFLYVVPEVAGFTLTPNPVKGGLSTTGKVTLAGVAGPGGVKVPIARYGTGLSHPAFLVIPAGTTNATFNLTTSAVTKKQTNKVYVKTGNVTKTVTLTINP
ncbi:hypothetical protein EON81_13130 [bacterium]|nr:MAG: hypothetical protein EON81_13130 [bacterium]